MYLIVIKGSNVGTVFSLNREGVYIIGRGEECDIKILDLMVSRRHCQIEVTRDCVFYIKDLNSTNKTFVNAKIVEDIVKLEIGDFVGTGDTLLFFTDQKEIPIKSVQDFAKMRMKQTQPLVPGQIPKKE